MKFIQCFREKNWPEAVKWYDNVINKDTTDTEGFYDGTMDDPHYLLVSRQATMYWEGGNGLEKDPLKAGEYRV